VTICRHHGSLHPGGTLVHIVLLEEFLMSATMERERITARVSSAVAETLNEAAELSGTTLNSFVVQAALKEAHRIIDREKTIYISSNDAAMLLNLLDKPSSPNTALTKAHERFMKAKYGIDLASTGESA
jgi:uncharacterized protein (DUF1778 family)